MLWLALHLPCLSLEAFCVTLPASAGQRPVALIDDQRVSAVNAAAAQRGIRPGIKRATALALAGDVLLGQADAARDADALRAVAHAALAFTPAVTLQEPATVLLEVQACLRYFGGLTQLLARLQQALVPLGHRLRLASAPTPLGAALLAQWRDGCAEGPHTTRLAVLQSLLGGAPVWLLGRSRAHWEALQGMGLQTLSDLRHLPRSGVARRFGEELLDDLDRAFGQRADPRQPLLPPPAFESRLELFTRADTSAQVLHGAGILLARLVAWTQAQQARIGAFTLQMRHEPRHRRLDSAADTADTADTADAGPTLLRIALAEPSLDAGHLQLLLRERLDRLELAAPTLDLHLVCSDIVQRAPPNGELFPSRQSHAQGLTRLLERLQARLGDAQVLRVLAVQDHRPERALRLLPAQRPIALTSSRPQPSRLQPVASARPLHRPVWLLAEAQPLTERQTLPLLGGRPLQLLLGPERIESGWWDGALATRDYFIAEAADRSLVWIYRDRIPAVDGSNWFLQGRFG